MSPPPILFHGIPEFPMPKYDYNLQLQDSPRSDGYRGRSIFSAGGVAIICLAGTSKKADVFGPRDGLQIANPVPFVSGKLAFGTMDTVTEVDIYGISPGGSFFVRRGIRPNQEPEIVIAGDSPAQVAVIPFDARDFPAGVETSTGIQLPQNSLVLPNVGVQVTTLEAARTMMAGLLSTESGGDADGFVVGMSMATAGIKKVSTATTATIGALLLAGAVPEQAPITTARTISITQSAGSTVAAGVLVLPYTRPLR